METASKQRQWTCARSAYPRRVDGDEGLWSPSRRPLTVGLVLTITLVAAEALAVTAAMPIVARDLGGLELYGLVFSAFLVGSLVGIVVAGSLIDRRGVVFPFILGLSLFGIGLALAGAAVSMPMLIAARLIQGIGGGAIPPIAYVAIGRSLPERLRPAMFATLSTAWILPGILGPGIAGIVAEAFHWRWVFFGLLPFILVSGTMALRGLQALDDGAPARIAGLPTTRIRDGLIVARRRLDPHRRSCLGSSSHHGGPGARRARDHDVGVPAARPARDAAGSAWLPDGRPAARVADLRVLHRRRVRDAAARRDPGLVRGGGGARADGGDRVLDRRVVDAGAALGALRARALRARRLPGGRGRDRRSRARAPARGAGVARRADLRDRRVRDGADLRPVRADRPARRAPRRPGRGHRRPDAVRHARDGPRARASRRPFVSASVRAGAGPAPGLAAAIVAGTVAALLGWALAPRLRRTRRPEAPATS